jgi:hypothetical protein
MALLQALNNCVPEAIPYPVIFGAQFLAIEAHPALNYTGPPGDVGLPIWVNHGPLLNVPVDFCNVTLTILIRARTIRYELSSGFR